MLTKVALLQINKNMVWILTFRILTPQMLWNMQSIKQVQGVRYKRQKNYLTTLIKVITEDGR